MSTYSDNAQCLTQEVREAAEALLFLHQNSQKQEDYLPQIKVEVVIAPFGEGDGEVDEEGEDSNETGDSMDSDPPKDQTDAKGDNNKDDLIPIGEGNAKIPASILRHVNWESHTSATRKLLSAVFSRRDLATHSLTGKRSPAFPTKEAKKQLDADVVRDIVQTVAERCKVKENLVRTCITTKLADECKMYRMRQNKRAAKKAKKT